MSTSFRLTLPIHAQRVGVFVNEDKADNQHVC